MRATLCFVTAILLFGAFVWTLEDRFSRPLLLRGHDRSESRDILNTSFDLPEGHSLIGSPAIAGASVLLRAKTVRAEPREELFLWQDGVGISSIAQGERFSEPSLTADGLSAIFLRTTNGKTRLNRWEGGFGVRELLPNDFLGEWSITLSHDGRFGVLLPLSQDSSVSLESDTKRSHSTPLALRILFADDHPKFESREPSREVRATLKPLGGGYTAAALDGSVATLSNGTTVVKKQLGPPRTENDLDGDGTTDLFLFASGFPAPFWQGTTTGGVDGGSRTVTGRRARSYLWRFGDPNGVPIPGDYNGDGVLDFATYNPAIGGEVQSAESNFRIYLSEPPGPVQRYHRHGVESDRRVIERRLLHGGDLPVPGDYDGDKKTDLALYSPKKREWTLVFAAHNFRTQALELLQSASPDRIPEAQVVSWGARGGIPIPGDYDGDGQTDLALYLPASGAGGSSWLVRSLKNSKSFESIEFGRFGDIPVPADFDGDGKSDLAVYRPSDQSWHIRLRELETTTIPWGSPSGEPITGDFDGDGVADLGFYDEKGETKWQIRFSSYPADSNNPFGAGSHSVWRSSWGGPTLLPPQVRLRRMYFEAK